MLLFLLMLMFLFQIRSIFVLGEIISHDLLVSNCNTYFKKVHLSLLTKYVQAYKEMTVCNWNCWSVNRIQIVQRCEECTGCQLPRHILNTKKSVKVTVHTYSRWLCPEYTAYIYSVTELLHSDRVNLFNNTMGHFSLRDFGSGSFILLLTYWL